MKEKFVGVYELGYTRVKIFLREGSGAGMQFLPKGDGIAEIRIGADEKTWGEVVASLVHEAMECCLSNMACEYRPFQYLRQSTANTSFFMTHEQFDESCARSGELIATCLLDLSRAWTAWKHPKKKKVHK